MSHKIILEALERLLLIEYLISKKQETTASDLLELPSGAIMEAAKEEGEISFLIQDYKESIRQGDMGKIAPTDVIYWLKKLRYQIPSNLKSHLVIIEHKHDLFVASNRHLATKCVNIFKPDRSVQELSCNILEEWFGM